MAIHYERRVHRAARPPRPPRPPQEAPDHDPRQDDLTINHARAAKDKLRLLGEELGIVSSRRGVAEALRRPHFLTVEELKASAWRGLSFMWGEIQRERDAQGRRLRIVLTEKDDDGHRLSAPTDLCTWEQLTLAIDEHLDEIEHNVGRVSDDIEDTWVRFQRCSRRTLNRFVASGGSARLHWIVTDP